MYKKFKPKFDEWRAKRKNKNKVVPEKEQLSAQDLHEQEQLSGSVISPASKNQSMTGDFSVQQPISPRKNYPRKIFPVSNESPALLSSGLFGDQNEKILKRKPRRITRFDIDLKFDSSQTFADTPTPKATIPIIGGVESAFYNNNNFPSSPFHNIKPTNQSEDKDNLLMEF